MTLLRCPKFPRCLTADARNFDRGHSLRPTVVPTDSRPLLWPPIGALPRNRLASSATGSASAISPLHPPLAALGSLPHIGPPYRTSGNPLPPLPKGRGTSRRLVEGFMRDKRLRIFCKFVRGRIPCLENASGGALSVTSDRKYPKNAAKTHGFGILARARCRKYRNLSPRE